MSTESFEDPSDHVDWLLGCESRQDAARYLQPLSKRDLLAIGRALEAAVGTNDSKATIVHRIVEAAVGGRLDAAAIRNANLAHSLLAPPGSRQSRPRSKAHPFVMLARLMSPADQRSYLADLGWERTGDSWNHPGFRELVAGERARLPAGVSSSYTLRAALLTAFREEAARWDASAEQRTSGTANL